MRVEEQLLAKEVKFMETFKADVVERESEYYLTLNIKDTELNIPLTKDEPNEVKVIFNHLILKLKKSPFKFEISEREEGDIFYNIAKEYISQLNSELDAIHKELDANHLLEATTESNDT